MDGLSQRFAGATPARLDGLTGLRGLAALLVVAYHYQSEPFQPLWHGAGSAWLDYGYLGVDLFFMLSGFVIWHVHGQDVDVAKPRGIRRFLLLRLARIYPVHLAMLAVLVLIMLIGSALGQAPRRAADFSVPSLILQLGLIQAWGFGGALSWNYPAWSISAEWFAYLLFPLLAPMLRRLPARGVFLVSGLLMLGLVAAYWGLFDQNMNQYSGWSLLRVGLEFSLGCLLRRVADIETLTSAAWNTACGLTLLVVAAACAMPGDWCGVAPVLGCPVLILAAARRGTWAARLFGAALPVRLGVLSYALYMVHAVWQKTAGRSLLHHYQAGLNGVAAWGLAAGFLLMLILATLALHYAVERPARQLLRARVFGARTVLQVMRV